MFSRRASFALEQEYKAQALARACANVALEKIRLNANYGGNESITFATDSCNILSISKNQNIYTINTRGIVSSVFRKNKIIVTRVEDPGTLVVSMTIQSWQEVADF